MCFLVDYTEQLSLLELSKSFCFSIWRNMKIETRFAYGIWVDHLLEMIGWELGQNGCLGGSLLSADWEAAYASPVKI